MKISEIIRAIEDGMQVDSHDYWNGLDDETQNEIIILGQREGVEAAISDIDDAAN